MPMRFLPYRYAVLIFGLLFHVTEISSDQNREFLILLTFLND